MTINLVDLEGMLNELKRVREKYSLPKGIIFVPDKMEISVQRTSYGNFRLVYEEFFTYIPNLVVGAVITSTINMLTQIGLPKESITRINRNGVRLELSGNLYKIIGCILSELLIQQKMKTEEASNVFTMTERVQRAFGNLSEYEYEWNDDIQRKFLDNSEKSFRLIQENPSIRREMQDVVDKYTKKPIAKPANSSAKGSGLADTRTENV